MAPVALNVRNTNTAPGGGDTSVEQSNVPVPSSLDSWLDMWTVEQIKEMQSKDPVLMKVIIWKTQLSEKPSKEEIRGSCKDVKAYLAQWENLKLDNGILYKVWHPARSTDECLQIVAPFSLRRFIFKQLHCSPTAGHFGMARTMKLVRARFFWLGYREDIDRWCRKCDICARVKTGPKRKSATLQQEAVGAPLERIALDICGPFNETENGNIYILVLCEYYTKWTEAMPFESYSSNSGGQNCSRIYR